MKLLIARLLTPGQICNKRGEWRDGAAGTTLGYFFDTCFAHLVGYVEGRRPGRSTSIASEEHDNALTRITAALSSTDPPGLVEIDAGSCRSPCRGVLTPYRNQDYLA
jgi:hypothetical protein